MLFLKRLKKIQVDNIILFSLGYAIVVIIAITLQAWLQSRLSEQFNLNVASITNLFYTPFIYCFISYNLLKPWILKKRSSKLKIRFLFDPIKNILVKYRNYKFTNLHKFNILTNELNTIFKHSKVFSIGILPSSEEYEKKLYVRISLKT